MSKPYTPPGSIREQLLNALDPGGQMQRELDAARRLPRWGPTAELRRLAAEHEALLETMVRYWAVLTDRGWGVANVGVELIRNAGFLLDQGDEVGADEVIATWFKTDWMSRTVARVEFLTDGTVAGRRLFAQRARLLHGAMQQADKGEFAGSIMTVLAQVEGITAHVTAPPEGGAGKLFFTKSGRRKADVVDTSDLASIPASLDRLRDVYSDDIPVAQAEGSLSRHGILHGQELAFDTKVNSAKCWSLLDVLVQWALPRGRERDAKVSGLRQSAHAGSQEADDRGRRIDDREFKVTRSALYEVCAGQSSYARRNQAFNADQARAKLSDDAMAKLGLPIPHGVMVQTSADAASFWAARRTISGWWLGRGLTLNDHGFVCLVLLGGR